MTHLLASENWHRGKLLLGMGMSYCQIPQWDNKVLSCFMLKVFLCIAVLIHPSSNLFLCSVIGRVLEPIPAPYGVRQGVLPGLGVKGVVWPYLSISGLCTLVNGILAVI